MDGDVLQVNVDPGVVLISSLANGITGLPLWISQLKTGPACPGGGLTQKRAPGAPVCLLLSDSPQLPAERRQTLSSTYVAHEI